MRRASCSSQSICGLGLRTIVGVAPLLYFPATSPQLALEKQIEQNTKSALELIQRVKGPLPTPYQRKYTQTVDQIEKEVDALLGNAATLRKTTSDDSPMDKLTLMERSLRHLIWSYRKDENEFNYEQFKKWLTYTEEDDTQLNLLKRQVELSERYNALKSAKKDKGGIPYPDINWTTEYARVIDREVVAEKRWRYDTLSINTLNRDEKQVNDLLRAYRRPTQEKRLDTLVDLVERFKPILAREAIMQRLTIKHLEGQLGVWRYLDWNPELRDRCELEGDNQHFNWVMIWEEKRLQKIKLRSRNEVVAIMEKKQIAANATASQNNNATVASGNATRDKLLKEVLALQARLHQREEEVKPEKEKTKKTAHH